LAASARSSSECPQYSGRPCCDTDSEGIAAPTQARVKEDRMRALVAAFAVTIAFLLVVACGNSDATPPPTAPTAGYGAYPPGYPAPAQGQPQAPPGYPPASYPAGYAPAAPQYPAPAPAPYPPTPPAPAAPYPAAPATTAAMSTPGLLALPCQSDAICGLHHCNTQYGKCAFPCQTPADCVSNNCIMGVCLPGS
jgi:hypothetical protein